MSRMAPGLDALLLANNPREESRPLHARIRLVDLRARSLVNHLAELFDMRMDAGVIVRRGQLNQLSNVSDRPIDAHVLVADDRLNSCLGLVSRGAEVLEHREGLDAAVDVKGHARGGEVLFGGADVVQKAG